MAFANINGTVLHYEFLTEDEDAPVVVFINSLGTDFRIWLPLIDELTANWSILLYDKRGHGLSDRGRIPCTIEDHADDLIGLCRHVGVKKAVFIGLSVGGLIVQALYRKKPELVRKIVLSNTAHKIGTPETWNPRIDAVEKGGVESVADSVLERWFTPNFRERRRAELAGYRNMLVRQDAAGYAETCRAIRDADFTESVSSIKVPVLAISGDQDGSTPPDLVKGTASMIEGSRFEVIPSCGHIPCVEQPEKLASLLTAFVHGDKGLDMPTASDYHIKGMATRRAVLGDSYVDAAEARKGAFDEPFQDLITEAAWGHVWSRPDWSKRERSIVTIALLAALGHDEEVAMHVRATANTGATPEDLREAMLHVAIYAGVPAANHAIKIIKNTLAEMNKV